MLSDPLTAANVKNFFKQWSRTKKYAKNVIIRRPLWWYTQLCKSLCLRSWWTYVNDDELTFYFSNKVTSKCNCSHFQAFNTILFINQNRLFPSREQKSFIQLNVKVKFDKRIDSLYVLSFKNYKTVILK